MYGRCRSGSLPVETCEDLMENKTSAERIAQALLNTGSQEYVGRAGAVLTELSAFAREGDLQNVSTLFDIYRKMVPADERKVREAIPVKILNQYFYCKEQLAAKAIERWEKAHPGWRKRVEEALDDPVIFEAVVRGMAEKIQGAEA